MRHSVVAAAVAILVAVVARSCAASGPSLSCCLAVTNTIPRRNRVVDYWVQVVPLCPVHAVLFLTSTGMTVCSDPEKTWVKKTIRWVDNKKRKVTASTQTIERPKSSLGQPRKKGRKRIKRRRQKKN
ncbi:C-C motif chemokine 3 precursor-like [Arapaima gigas]